MHSLANGPSERHELIVETRELPSAQPGPIVRVDLMDSFPVRPEEKGRVFPERPVAREFRSAAIRFSHDRRRVTLFLPQANEFASAF